MKKINILIISVLLVAIVSSCTFEKRLYRPGFYVETNSYRTSKKQQELTTIQKQSIAENKIDVSTFSSTVENNVAIQTNSQELGVSKTSLEPVFALNHSDKKVSTWQPSIYTSYKQRISSIISENKKAWEVYQANPLAKGGKSQIVALLLCFFLGMLGIHSFYLGNKQKGIIQLVMFLVGWLTFLFIIGYLILAALGIWVLIDFIRIIIGDLGPGW